MEESTWLRPLCRREAPRLRLLCLPHAGGGGTVFRHWPGELPEHVEVWSVRLPGREDRIATPPAVELSTYVTALADELHRGERWWRDRPWALFGHSFGALLGFELARALRRRAAAGPRLLALSGAPAVHLGRGWKPLHLLPRDELVEELRSLWGESVAGALLDDPAILDMAEPALRADLACCVGYRYEHEPPLPCDLSVFAGSRDLLVSHGDLAAWRGHGTGRFRLRTFAGSHFYLMPQQRLLERLLARDIEAAIG